MFCEGALIVGGWGVVKWAKKSYLGPAEIGARVEHLTIYPLWFWCWSSEWGGKWVHDFFLLPEGFKSFLSGLPSFHLLVFCRRKGESKVPLCNPSDGKLFLKPASYNKLLDRVAFRILSNVSFAKTPNDLKTSTASAWKF